MPSLAALRDVRRLCIGAEALLDAPNTLLHKVTHLELLRTYNSNTRDLMAPLGIIPHLTHIAFHGALPNTVLLRALCADARLQCIVFFRSAPEVVNIRSLATDIRVVGLQLERDFYEHWLSGIAGDDFWSVAESSIAARRACEAEREPTILSP